MNFETDPRSKYLGILGYDAQEISQKVKIVSFVQPNLMLLHSNLDSSEMDSLGVLVYFLNLYLTQNAELDTLCITCCDIY